MQLRRVPAPQTKPLEYVTIESIEFPSAGAEGKTDLSSPACGNGT